MERTVGIGIDRGDRLATARSGRPTNCGNERRTDACRHRTRAEASISGPKYALGAIRGESGRTVHDVPPARRQNGPMTETTTVPAGLFAAEDAVLRCQWCRASTEYRRYHDEEWGFPVDDERRLFEKICLEGFQAGLSWLTILNKREAFRKGFANFDAAKVAKFGDDDIERLVADAGIVRHRGKIVSTINNAQRVLELRREFGSLAAYAWRHEPDPKTRPKRLDPGIIGGAGPSAEAVAMSKDLKKRGWTFVGPTTVYAFMQAMGLVNDHYEQCHAREKAFAARKAFTKPD